MAEMNSGLQSGIWRGLRVIGYEDVVQAPAFGYSCGNGEHDSISERYYCRLHVLILVVAFGYGFCSLQEAALEIFVYEI